MVANSVEWLLRALAADRVPQHRRHAQNPRGARRIVIDYLEEFTVYQRTSEGPRLRRFFVLKDLLQKKMSAATDAGMSLMDGSLDAAQRADLAKQIKSQTDDYDTQIKQFLGDENYQAFQAYEKTTPDRMTVSQFNDQLAGGATALTADQQQQLIQMMSNERNNFKWTVDYNNKTALNGDYASMFTEDKVNQFAKEKEQLDQQILTQAQQFLTPEQLASFQQFQTTQRAMQAAGMKIAAQMFAPK